MKDAGKKILVQLPRAQIASMSSPLRLAKSQARAAVQSRATVLDVNLQNLGLSWLAIFLRSA